MTHDDYDYDSRQKYQLNLPSQQQKKKKICSLLFFYFLLYITIIGKKRNQFLKSENRTRIKCLFALC